MNPWIAKALVLTATVMMIAIRAPHGHASRRVRVIKSHKTPLDAALLILAWAGFFILLIWIASPVFSFAEYPLRWGPLFEERMMFEQCGDEYTAYMARTQRLVPGVW